jgi:hypothetical protein
MTIVSTLGAVAGEIGHTLRALILGRIRDKQTLRQYREHAVPGTLPWTWDGKPNRVALVNLLMHGRLLGDYLEIGCDTNVLFDSVAAANKVGVDPSRGGTLRMASDAFFASNERLFDVIWIDGQHTYEQVRRDVVNAIASLKPGGWVGIHDLLPRNWIEGFVPRLIPEGAWSGDVWKVAFELARSDGIDFRILNIDRGVGVFRVTDPAARLVDMQAELTPATFGYLRERVTELPIIEWDAGFRWIVDAKRDLAG